MSAMFIVEKSDGRTFKEVARYETVEAAIKCAEELIGTVRVSHAETWRVYYSFDAHAKAVHESWGLPYEPNLIKRYKNG